MDRTKACLEHIVKLLGDEEVPDLKDDCANNPLLVHIHDELLAIRNIMRAFSEGDFSSVITVQGVITSYLKALQANLQLLIRHMNMVEMGDFSKEVHTMGEISPAFNKMLNKLRSSLSELQEEEKNLKESEAHLKFLANHDPLTGVYNRRSFIELAGLDLFNAANLAIPCCMAMMDIDHFKDFNDTYGHLAGDEALRHTVKTIETGLRKNDFMGRYGGEEFILFFYDTDEDTGFRAVDRIRKSLPEKPVLLKDGPVSIYASFGLVGSAMADPRNHGNVQVLINAADTALYIAKRTGRNRTVLYNSSMTQDEV